MDTKTLSDFDRSIKALRRSKLAKTPEFNNMVLASERFHRDAKLASLTRKDQNQMGQMFEDGQFFSILLGMLTEVSRSSGLKQRDDLRKVYHWYQMNKDVLHCRPGLYESPITVAKISLTPAHFQSVSTPPNKSPPELKFSPEVIKYYSLPPDKRKSKQVEFKDSNESPSSTHNDSHIRKNGDAKGANQRPVTAPPVLNRPKVENTLPSNFRKSWRGQQVFVEESGLSIAYINNHLTPKKYMAALERPSSAMAVVRQYQQSLDPNLDDADDDDDISSDGKLSTSFSTDLQTEGSQSGMPHAEEDVSGSGMPPTEGDVPGESTGTESVGDPEDKNDNGEDGEIITDASGMDDEKGKDIDGKVNPIPVEEGEAQSITNEQVTGNSFIDDESYGDGPPPDEKKYTPKMIEVNIPAVGDESASISSQVNLQKWHEYQQSHSSFHSNNAMATGNSQSDGLMVEMPELSTNQVIAEYAENAGPVNIPGSTHYDQSQSLEDFYKASEKFSPSVNPTKPSPRKQSPSGQPTQPVGKLAPVGIHPDEQTRDIVAIAAQQEGNQQDKSLHLDSVVDLAGPVSDQMVQDKESQEELIEPRLRHRMPSAQIPTPRPHTALGHSSVNHVVIPDGRTRTSPASTPRSSLGSQESPRSISGDALVGYPSHCDGHFRRKARPVTAPTLIPHAVQRTPIRPDSTRYRSKSASPRGSLRTAGSTSGGGRPRTASSLRYTEWMSVKPLGSKIRVPGAASHSSLTIHPLTISAMMSVKHLGGTSSSFREQLNPKASRFWNNEGIPEDLPPNLEFMSISRPAPVHEGKLKEESDKTQKSPSGSENLDSLQQEEVRDWTSTHDDSIEGLVQLGRARSERGGGDADSQRRDSLGGSTERGLSPEPADLSDLENETPGVTPREETELRMKEDDVGKFVGNNATIDDKSKEDAAQKENTANEEGAKVDGNPEENQVTGGSENGTDEEIQLDQKLDHASESENVGSDTTLKASEEGKMDGIQPASDDAQGGREDGTMKDTEDEAECEERGETVEVKGESVDDVETDMTEKVDIGESENDQGERLDDGGIERTDSKVTFSIFESVDDEDYFEPPLVHLEDRQHSPSSIRTPQVVIPKVRDPNGQLVDVGLEVETYPKPLTPRDAGQSQGVTISGTRQRPKGRKEEEDTLAGYLLTEEEPSPKEQSNWRIKADVQRKPLWERRWSRGYRRDAVYLEHNTVSGNPEVVTKYRLSLAEFGKKISPGHRSTSGDLINPSGVADEKSVDGESNIYTRRPQTPKRFEVLEPRPFKPVTDEWKGRPVPEVGGAVDEEAEMKAVERQRAAKQAVQIGKLFSKKADKAMKQMQKELEWSRWEKRWEEADASERNHLRHLMRKEAAILNRSGVMDDSWEQMYTSQRHLLQQEKSKERKDEFKKRNKMSRREKTDLNRIGASLEIWDIFREGRRGTSKRQRRAAAIMIQKHVRGWLARLKFEKIKQKSRVHATSYKGFAKYYSKLMHKVARWHGVKSPVIHIKLKEIDEFMDKKRYFENMFARRAYPRRKLEYRELKDFFRDCDLYPTQREMYNAVLGVTRKTPDDPHTTLTEEQVAEVAFMIYVPDGSGLDKTKTRQSTWLNPLVDGKEANKFIGSEEYYAAKLSKSMQLVFAAHKERVEREAAEKRKAECVSNDGEGEEEVKMTDEEKKKHQLEAWIKKERERERLEEEKRRRPVRAGELETNYQFGEEGLLEGMAASDPTVQ